MNLDSNHPEDESALFDCKVKLWTVTFQMTQYQWVALECYPPGKK